MSAESAQGIFRRKALDKLSSPEDLDRLMHVTDPRGWLALVALAAVIVAALGWGFLGSVATSVTGQGIIIRHGGIVRVHAPAGEVVVLLVKDRDEVKLGQVVARVRLADGTVVDVPSRYTGQVIELLVDDGEAVDEGASLISLEREDKAGGDLDDHVDGIFFVPFDVGTRIEPGMPVQVSPASVHREEYGFLVGHVKTVSAFPATPEGIFTLLRNEKLVDQLLADGPVTRVVVALELDPATPSGYRWSSGAGPPDKVATGTFTVGEIVLREQRPISLILPALR